MVRIRRSAWAAAHVAYISSTLGDVILMSALQGNPIEDARDFIARMIDQGPNGLDAYIDWIWNRRIAFQEVRIREMRERHGLPVDKIETRSWPIARAQEQVEPANETKVAQFGKLSA